MVSGKKRWYAQPHNLIFLLFAVFLAGGVLYSYDSFVRHGVQLIIIIISFLFFLKTLSFKNNAVYKAWTALLLLNTCGFILTADITNNDHLGLFIIILTNSLPFYPIYYWTRKNQFKKEDLVRFFILILPIVISLFYFSKTQLLSEATGNSDNVVNNAAYIFVFLIPYTFLLKKRIVSIIALFVVLFFIIQGAKRGAAILGVVGLLYFCYFQLTTIDKKRRLQGYFIAIIGISILSYFAYDFFMSNEYLIERLQRINLETGEGSSGRNIIFKDILEGWYNSDNLINLLFGFGFAASLKLTHGHFAHNDWLELLSNFGLLGVATYIFVFVSILKHVSKLNDRSDKITLICIVSIWLGSTMFSMNYISGFSYIQSIVLTYFVVSKNQSKVTSKTKLALSN